MSGFPDPDGTGQKFSECKRNVKREELLGDRGWEQSGYDEGGTALYTSGVAVGWGCGHAIEE